MKMAGVPDLSDLLLSDQREMSRFLEVTRSVEAAAFRRWFHSKAGLDEKEIVRAYIDVLHDIPRIQRAPARTMRFIATVAAGLLHAPLGVAASAVDNFVLDKLLARRWSKFFIEKLRKFSGQIKSKP